MPTRAEFEEEKHKRSSLGTFAEKPAEPKAYISLSSTTTAPTSTTTTTVRKLEEDEVPTSSPNGSKIVDYSNGVATYADGSSYSAEGWKSGSVGPVTRFADEPAPPIDTKVNPNSAGFIPTAEKVDPRAAAAVRARHDAARRKVERERIAKRREERLAARRRQLRDRSARQHGEPPESVYDNFYEGFDKDDIRRLKDKYLWTVQDNSIEQNLILARKLGWPTGKGKDGHTFIVTPWGTRYRGNKPKKPRKAKKAKKAKKAAKPQGFWHGFTSSGGPVTIEELRGRVHRTPVITASAADLRARVHGKVVMATATSAWNSDARKKAAAKGVALPDGSYPIKDKRDWAKAKQALGRAKNRAVVVKHLIKRAKALGIPAEKYKGLTASTNTGMVAAMVAAPLSLGEMNVGEWLESLHPRGRDGKFIDKFGFVSGRFVIPSVGVFNTDRAKVVGFAENTDDSKDPFVVVEKDGQRAYGRASGATQVAGPKGSVGGEPVRQTLARRNSKDQQAHMQSLRDKALAEDAEQYMIPPLEEDDKQLSLADAPIGGNKEMPDTELDGALRDMLSLATDEVEITDDDQQRIDVARAALDGDGDSKAALQDMLSLVTDAAEITPADQTRIDAARSVLGIDHDYTGPGDAIEPYDPITELNADMPWEGGPDIPGVAREGEDSVDVAFRERITGVILNAILSWEGNNAAELASDAAEKLANPLGVALDNPDAEETIRDAILSWEGNNAAALAADTAKKISDTKLMADDQGRERYDANEAAGRAQFPAVWRRMDELAEHLDREERMRGFEAEFPNAANWRADLAKVQNALEQGGWITSTPDADAPGGTFTYIDPDAPPELVALYQKLIQYGFANGYEP